MTYERGGFGTSVHSDDLADELIIESHAEDPKHRALINSIYTLCYRNVLALVPRPSSRSDTGMVMDLIGRQDSRGSGQNVTYVCNTYTNAKNLIGRQLEADGIITEEDINTEDENRAVRIQEKMNKALEEYGEKLCSQMAVSGDDSVVANNNKEYGRALHYINASGKVAFVTTFLLGMSAPTIRIGTSRYLS